MKEIELNAVSKYDYFIAKAKEDFKELIEKTKTRLLESNSKGEDLYELCLFWGNFMPEAITKWDNSSALFMDNLAMMPMPDSVAKQFVNMLFGDAIKNIDLLFDLDIDQGLELYETYKECPNADYPTETKEETVKRYNEYFER